MVVAQWVRSTAHDNCHVKFTMEYTFFLLQELPKICTYLCTTLRSAQWNVFCGPDGPVWRKIPLYGIFVPCIAAKWVQEPCKNCAGKLTFGKVNKLLMGKLCGMTMDTKKAPSGRGLWSCDFARISTYHVMCRGGCLHPPAGRCKHRPLQLSRKGNHYPQGRNPSQREALNVNPDEYAAAHR